MRTRSRRLALVLAPLLFACGGGGGGGGHSDPPPPPGPPATIENTGLAIGTSYSDIAVLAPYALVKVSEAEMGTDLNGDGDTNDSVVSCIDTRTGMATNLGFACVGKLLASDSRFAFLVPEAGQGGVDLNADGDVSDAVWFVYDPAAPIGPTNPAQTGFVSSAVGLPAVGTKGGFFFEESEAAQETDLDGDGDSNDLVAGAFVDSSAAEIHFGIACAPNTPLRARAGRVLFTGSEAAMSRDLNGDGDATDLVLYAVDLQNAGALIPMGPKPSSISTYPYELTDYAAVFFIDEATQGATDLNGDGDTQDAILTVYAFSSGGNVYPTSPQLPMVFAVAGAPGAGIATGSSRAIVAVSEHDQNKTDLDGDGDAFDNVLAWIDTKSTPGALEILPYAVSALGSQIDGNKGLVPVLEQATGVLFGQDFNGDGDAFDTVAFLLDSTMAPGTATSLSLAVGTLSVSGSDALIGVDEQTQFGADRNGNGVATDVVLQYVGLDSPTTASLNLSAVSSAFTFFRTAPDEIRVAAVMKEGQSMQFNDLNGDGDLKDNALVLFGIDPSVSPPKLRPGTPFVAGTAALVAAPPISVGPDVFLFPTSEAMAEKDMNGDGDTSDTVLRIVRYIPRTN